MFDEIHHVDLSPELPMPPAPRYNSTWIDDLSSRGWRQEAALADLREELFRNLRKATLHHSSADAAFVEDTVQEALLRVLDRLDQFQGKSRFVTWATSIAIRLAFAQLRRRHWRDVSLQVAFGENLAEPVIAESPDAAEISEQMALVRDMYHIIRTKLTARQRDALLAELKGIPQDEIAKQLKTNRNAIYKLTHDARKKLKKHLGEAGYVASDISFEPVM